MTMFTELVSKVLISSDNTAIYAECVGNHAKPHIIFVHGFTLCGSVFDKIFCDAKYQEEYFLVRYDMRGHGRSGKPDSMESYSSQLYANDFMSVSSAFDLKKPTYVGWSLGGTPAADIIACLPEHNLSGIVYIASFFGTHFIPHFASSFAMEQVAVLINDKSTPEALKTATLRFSDGVFDWVSDCHPYSPSDAYLRQLRRWDVQSSWLGYGVSQSTTHRYNVIMREQDTEPLFALGGAGFPVLIVHGTRDALVHSDKKIDEAKKRFTNLTVALIEDGGSHAPFLANPGLVMKHIGSFAKGVQTKVGTSTHWTRNFLHFLTNDGFVYSTGRTEDVQAFISPLRHLDSRASGGKVLDVLYVAIR